MRFTLQIESNLSTEGMSYYLGERINRLETIKIYQISSANIFRKNVDKNNSFE